MERYTEKHYDGNGYYLVCSGNCETLNCGDCGILDKIVDRLAAYEKTGLEPCDYSAMDHALKQAERAKEDLTEMIRQIGATGLDRLRELAQADREERCVVLPCKKGDTVWRIVYDATPHITKDRCTNIKVENKEVWVNLIGDRVMGGWNFGKLLFLNEKEAEVALKAREQDGNNK